MSFQIGSQEIGVDKPAFVIAEAGSNHNGDKQMAHDLIDVAADAGVDAVKFQTFRADRMYPKDSGDIGTADGGAHSVLKGLEMPYDWIPELARHADERDLYFLSSPFDRKSADLLHPHVPAYKVASTLVSHHPFLEYLDEKNKPLIISTGVHTMDNVEAMMAVLDDREDLALLQCVSAYPTPLNRANVAFLNRLRSKFGCPTGLSDHTEQPAVAPMVAAALGAAVIEKHVTLDSTLDGPDHSFALEPDQLDHMVSQVRRAEQALGDGEKTVLDIERETYENGRRCLHAARSIKAGTQLESTDVECLRPGENPRGIPPSEQSVVIGRSVRRDIEAGEPIDYDDLED